MKKFTFKEKQYSIREMPYILRRRYNKILALALVTFLIGTLFILIGFGSIMAIIMMFWITALAALILALKYKYDLEHKGFATITGVVTHKKEILSVPVNLVKDRSFKRPYYYHIKTNDNKLYRLDVTKGSEEIPLKSNICIYYPTTAFEHIGDNGLITLSSYWVYEIVDENNDPLTDSYDDKNES